MRSLIAGALLVVLACAGCASSWVRTGNPGGFGEETQALPRENFDAVAPGMTRQEVVRYLGTPLDESLNVMHWQTGEDSDAWVVFDETGQAVASKYWQDRETLRLEDVPPVP